MEHRKSVSLSHPNVSVLLPNVNNRQFLEERFQSIMGQTYADWELIIVDGYSDDGAWEFIQRIAAEDARIHPYQAPRQGVYAALNQGVELARGNYVYIAMSDDSMTEDCLEKMVLALDNHPGCDVCHCCLSIVDEEGNEFEDWRQFESVLFYGPRINHVHIRKAPLDGILQCALYMMHCSLTQLLLRKTIFQKVGLFPTQRGSIGDFEWNLKVGFLCDILHIPDTLATWRRHATQSTDADFLKTAEFHAMLCDMITATLPVLQTAHPQIYKKIRPQRLLFPYRQIQCITGVGEQSGWTRKIGYLASCLVSSPQAVADFLIQRLSGKLRYLDRTSYIHKELEHLGLELDTYVVPC